MGSSFSLFLRFAGRSLLGGVAFFTMIYPRSNATETSWARGEYQVQLNLPGNSRPMGFCDGTDADIAELQAIAESEGADEMRIERKRLKTGREIWTLHGGAQEESFED